MARKRVIIFADESRRAVAHTLTQLRAGLTDHVAIDAVLPANGDPLDDAIAADFAVAIGGDGTIISQTRRVVDIGLPMIGVNVGRFGFLAEFDADNLIELAPVIFGDAPPPMRKHMLLQATVADQTGAQVHESLAVNDAVITAGRPFRMIQLRLTINGDEGPTLNGDGVVISTPVGSTAYNASAGGPIVHPAVEAFNITPLAAHSLAFRPIVIPATSSLDITLSRANEGTMLVLDGQGALPLSANMRVVITRHDRAATIVTNPTNHYWGVLLEKMRWAAPPSYRDRGP